MKYRYEDVFKPGSFPEYTYISRNSGVSDLPYEFRLLQAIKVSGFLTSLIGPSKMGKSILCEKVIGIDKLIEISGADFDEETDFWRLVASKAGLSYEGKFSAEKTVEATKNKYEKQQVFTLTKDKIIEAYIENDYVLVIDDFHYAPSNKRLQVAQQLKDAIRRGFKAVVISLPHRSDDAIRQNADLSGRLSLINMEPWKVDELKEIAILGFDKLEIEISDDMANRIAVESLSSPQLMQYICLNICTIMDLENKSSIDLSIIEKAYRYTTANFEYKDVVSYMSKGPSTRGKSRNLFKALDGNEYDLYQLIVKSIAENPPIMKLGIEEIKERVYSLLKEKDKLPTIQAIKDSLNKLHDMLSEREDIFRVLDWKEGCLYILDPIFLFYLRWGDNENV